MIEKNSRLDIRTTKAAKNMLEQAANTLGTSLSAFLLDCYDKSKGSYVTISGYSSNP